MCRAAHKASLCDNANLLSGVPRDNVPLMCQSNPLFPPDHPRPSALPEHVLQFSVKFVCAPLSKSLHISDFGRKNWWNPIQDVEVWKSISSKKTFQDSKCVFNCSIAFPQFVFPTFHVTISYLIISSKPVPLMWTEQFVNSCPVIQLSCYSTF